MKRFLSLIFGAAMLCGCTADDPGQIMDGDGMEYDFITYNIKGDWVQIGTDTPWHLQFTNDTVKWTDENGKEGTADFSAAESGYTAENTLTFSGGDIPFETMLFRRMKVGAWPVSLLYQTDSADAEPERVFVYYEDERHIPEGFIPPLTPPATDEEKLNRTLMDEILRGSWTEIRTDEPAKLEFEQDQLRYTGEESTLETAYILKPAGNAENLVRVIEPSEMTVDFMELHYRLKNINGSKVRMIFGIELTDGGADDMQVTKVFAHTDDLDLIPADYVPGYEKDDVYVYAPETEPADGLFVSDAMEMLEWLGRTPADAGIDEKYITEWNIPFDGKLFGKTAVGRIENKNEIERIVIYTELIGFDECCAAFEKIYGTPEEYDIPYMGGRGTGTGRKYTDDRFRIDVSTYTEADFTMVEFSLID